MKIVLLFLIFQVYTWKLRTSDESESMFKRKDRREVCMGQARE